MSYTTTYTTTSSNNYLSRYPFALSGKYDHMDVVSDTLTRNARAKTELQELLWDGLKVDRARFQREFLTPEPTTTSRGYYWPKHQCNGYLETASAHIPYLARPMFNYRAPSKFGYSKYVTVRK